MPVRKAEHQQLFPGKSAVCEKRPLVLYFVAEVHLTLF